jgi:beta-glucosidase
VASQEHKQLALDMARKSIVLLKNNGILPLSTATANSFPSVASDQSPTTSLIVMGPNANDSVMMWGNYSGYPTRTITALEGIQEKITTKHIQGCGLTRNESFESRFSEIKDPLGNSGIQVTYWNNTEMKGEPVTVVNMKQSIKLSNGGNTVFAPGVSLENFSARFDGTLIPTQDETLIFNISGDDKLRLIVNADTLVNYWNPRQRIQTAKKEWQVKAGEHYRIQIDYVQETGFAALSFDVQHKIAPKPEELLAQIGNVETIIFVGGISPSLEGEEMRVSEPGFKGGDRTSIELPQAQRDVLALLHKAGKKVIFVNCSGSAIALTPELETCDAILQWWYGGEMGGKALAEVLFGDVNPSGKLPVTFYKNTDELPDFLDYTMKNRTYRYYTGEALFPFGYGLSYTNFEIGKPAYNNHKVSVNVKNIGTMSGIETVQVYLRSLNDPNGPLKSLKAYTQVSLDPGQSKTVTIELPRQSFEGWDEHTNTMRVVPGRYELMVGNSSADKDLKKMMVNIK